jgi:type 1 glutamine amidotransferase
MNRRELLRNAGAAALAYGVSRLPLGWTAPADGPKKRVLMYTRSQGFEHSVVKRGAGGKLSLAEQIVTDLAGKHDFEVVCEKDGRIFLAQDFPKFDAFLFETQGDLTSQTSKDNSPPMTADGKKALLDAIAAGKGFVGCHCASDTFHSPGHAGGNLWKNQDRDKLDPYILMIGGEFSKHGEQQKAWMRVVDPDFPGLKGVKDFEKHEEWYSIKNFAPDLHVILVQDTTGMRNLDYERPNFPATWARMNEKGRVFYTSMGHREDVWESKLFQDLLMGGLSWALGNVKADLKPNLAQAAPKASELPKPKQ